MRKQKILLKKILLISWIRLIKVSSKNLLRKSFVEEHKMLMELSKMKSIIHNYK
jgi:hypothetical protein